MSIFDILGGILEIFSLLPDSNSSRSSGKTEENEDNPGYVIVFFIVLFLAIIILLAFDGIFAINYLIPVLVIDFILSFILGLLFIRLLYKLQITEPLRLRDFVFFLLTMMIIFFTILLFVNFCFKITG